KEPVSNWEPEALFISPLAVRIGKDGQATKLLTGGWDPVKKTGGLRVRPATGGETSVEVLKNEAGKTLLPTVITAFALPEGGDATALLLPVGFDTEGRRYELRLLAPSGTRKLTLKGFNPQQPVLIASPNGRFVAVAGFNDNRVEVYDTTGL